MTRHGKKKQRLTAPLRHRDFRLLITSFFISFAGSWAYNVALAVFVFEKTGSAAWVGAATVGRFVPSLLLGAYGGVLADRFERVRLMAALDVMSTVLMAGLALLAALDGPVLLAIALAGMTSVTGTVYEPTAAAITPETVPESELAAANALRNMVDNVAIVGGPVLGALLLLVGPTPIVFLVNSASFAVSAVVITRMSVRSRPVDVTESGTVGPVKQMLVGMQAIASSSTASVLVAYSVVASFVYGVDTVQFVVLSEERLGTGPDGYGYLLAGLGVGGIAAAGLVNRIASWPRLGTVILVGMATYCLPTLLFLVVDNPAAAFVIQGVRGGGTLVVDVLAITALQRSLPSDLLGRVFGAFFTFVLLAISLGALVTPQVIQQIGLDASIWMAGLVLPALCLLGLPWLRTMDRANVAHLALIEPRVAALQKLGILADASRPVLEQLATQAVEQEVPAGTVVIHEGDEADALYVLLDGQMAVRARGEGDLERELAPMESGAYFGEIGLLERIPRTATVESTRASRVLRIEGEQFLDALTNAPASTALLEGARSRLSRTHPSRRSADVAQGRHAGLAAQAEKPLLHDRGDEVAAGGEDAPGGEPPAAGR
jgi:CRP-like cAMP-binding protein/MFS family permease